MSSMNIDPSMWAKFQAFLAFEEAAKANNNQGGQGREPDGERSPTAGRSSVAGDPPEEQRAPSDRARVRSLTVGRSSDAAETPNDQTAPPSRSPTPEPKEKARKSRLESRAKDKAPFPTESDEPQSPEHSTTPRAFARQDKRDKNPPKAAVLTTRKRARSPSPRAGPSKCRRSPSPTPKPEEEPKALHPYDTCPTSYEQRLKKRGGCIKIEVNGKEEIARTPMEQLVFRKAKYKHVREHGHLFGDKHGCYFNPYSKSRINEKICKRIPKPAGFQVGRGGANASPWHWLIGLRDDYDFAMSIRGAARKALVMYRPPRLDLKPGQKLAYKHYGPTQRTLINSYMYKKFGFLFHFQNVSGDESWAIDAICTGYLASNAAHVQTGNNKKAIMYLKRNESGPNGEEGEGANEEGEGAEDDDDDQGYEDDYALNARRHAKNTQPASTSHSSTTKKRPHADYADPRPVKESKRSQQDDDDSADGDDYGHSSSPTPLPPQPSAADIRKADKLVAKEKACDKALGASRDNARAKPVAASKGKGKEREGSPVASGSKVNRRKKVVTEDDEDDDEDDEPIRTVSKVIRRVNSSLSEPETSKPPVKNIPKAAPEALTKSGKRKVASSPPEEELEEEPKQWKRAKRPPPKPAPEPEPEPEPEDEPEGDEEELEPLPSSLIPQINRELEAARSGRKQDRGKANNGGEGATKPPPTDKSKAITSNKSAEQSRTIATEELVASGRAKPVGTIKIKVPVPPSGRSLRKRT